MPKKTSDKDILVTMTEVKTDLKYIKKSLIDNDRHHKDILDLLQKHIDETDKRLELKANKEDVVTLRSWFISSLIFVITLLISVIGYLLSKIIFK